MSRLHDHHIHCPIALAGVSGFRAGRMDELVMHPTVKPTAMIADALKDCSRRASLVLDPFGCSGSTLIAAEKTGRRAALMEIDPAYVDVIVRRWQTYTGKTALLAETDETNELVAERRAPAEPENAPSAAAPAPANLHNHRSPWASAPAAANEDVRRFKAS